MYEKSWVVVVGGGGPKAWVRGRISNLSYFGEAERLGTSALDNSSRRFFNKNL